MALNCRLRAIWHDPCIGTAVGVCSLTDANIDAVWQRSDYGYMARSTHSVDHDEGIPSYLSRLTQAPLLTAEEEASLTRAVQRGDRASRQKLVESNMRLVINIAKSYRNRSIPLEDLIQ